MVDNLPPSLDNVEPTYNVPLPEDFSNFLNGPLPSYDSLGDYFPAADLSHLEKPPTVDEIEGPYGCEVTLPGKSSGRKYFALSCSIIPLSEVADYC